jgi:hypothetical protein
MLLEWPKILRSGWDAVERSLVDNPSRAVRQADVLVAQMMESLAETFSNVPDHNPSRSMHNQTH